MKLPLRKNKKPRKVKPGFIKKSGVEGRKELKKPQTPRKNFMPKQTLITNTNENLFARAYNQILQEDEELLSADEVDDVIDNDEDLISDEDEDSSQEDEESTDELDILETLQNLQSQIQTLIDRLNGEGEEEEVEDEPTDELFDTDDTDDEDGGEGFPEPRPDHPMKESIKARIKKAKVKKGVVCKPKKLGKGAIRKLTNVRNNKVGKKVKIS
jgi:hypothetical protein